jgi:hypothetical protein
MTLIIEVPDTIEQRLSETASRLNIPTAELVAALLRDMAGRHEADFQAAAARVLGKNQELYRRLAQGPGACDI